MLMPISPINQTNFANKIRKTNNQTPVGNDIPQTNGDKFEKSNISFQGRNIKTLKLAFDNAMITEAKKGLAEGIETWKEYLFTTKYAELKATRPNHEIQLYGLNKKYNTNNTADRIKLGFFTLGMSELKRLNENREFRKEAKVFVKRMISLRNEIKHIQLNEKIAQLQKKTTENINFNKYEASVKDVKDNEIMPKLLEKFQHFQEGKPTKMPNCVLFSNEDGRLNTRLIQWIEEHTNNKFDIINNNKLSEALENAEENFQKTGKWNLLNLYEMDRLINPEFATKEQIESIKRIMSNCAEDYHTTIIFKTRTPEKLDAEALQAAKVTKIDTSKVIPLKDMEIESAKKRLSNPKYAEDTPIAALNDLLLVSGNEHKVLGWNYSKPSFEYAEESLKDFANNSEYADNVTSVLDSLRNIW